jgi:serine/threonine protein kinase
MQKWTVIQPLGTLNGGLNAGITTVKCNSNPRALGKIFIEKRFGAKQFKYRVPHHEIQLLHQINDHMNIATMVDHFLHEASLTAAVYLEYCNMGSLDAVVYEVAKGRGRVHERKVWAWFFQICGALAYCHCGPDPKMSDDDVFQSGWSRIYHRDIKPANILLTTEGGQIVAKLADFGCGVSEDLVAQGHSERGAIMQEVGTPGFEAPEYPYFSAASDVWQLGVTVMCLCNGVLSPWSRMNFKGQPWDELRPVGPTHSVALDNMIKLCLLRNSQQRSTAYQVLQLLDQASVAVMATLAKDTLPLDIFEPVAQKRAPRRQEPMAQPEHRGHMLPGQGARRPWTQMNAHGYLFP